MPDISRHPSSTNTELWYEVKNVEASHYRCQLSIEDFRDTPHDQGLRVAAFRIDQREHPGITYTSEAENIYRGNSVEDAWDKIEEATGITIEMPDLLVSIDNGPIDMSDLVESANE